MSRVSREDLSIKELFTMFSKPDSWLILGCLVVPFD